MRYLLLVMCGLMLSIGWVSAQNSNPIALYVSTTGDDANDGLTPETSFRTITQAWNQIPMGMELTHGYSIIIAPGIYTAEETPNYWESRYGTEQAPIKIRAETFRDTVFFPPINAFDVRYISFIDLNIEIDEFDPFHCERCDHLTLIGMKIRGADPETYATQEAVKINQSQYVHIAQSDISGAWDNAIDLVAVQYAEIVSNRIHNAGDWCAYAKGGSAYIRVESNDIYDCGTGGFTAGQGTGFQFMTPPWIQYEAYAIEVIDNYIYDIRGAGIGVQGGYQVLIAGNTFVRVGERSHLLEVVYGSRSCDGSPSSDDPIRVNCVAFNAQGGWGNDADASSGENYVRIPNKHVYIYNNVFYNPPGYQSSYQHMTIFAPFDGDEQSNSNLGTVVADEDLRIVNNVFVNGDDSMSLGVLDDHNTGCPLKNATCNTSQLFAENRFAEEFVSVLTTETGLEVTSLLPDVPIPDFPAWDVPVPNG